MNTGSWLVFTLAAAALCAASPVGPLCPDRAPDLVWRNLRNTNAVHAVAFSPDASSLVGGSQVLHVYDLDHRRIADGTLIQSFTSRHSPAGFPEGGTT